MYAYYFTVHCINTDPDKATKDPNLDTSMKHGLPYPFPLIYHLGNGQSKGHCMWGSSNQLLNLSYVLTTRKWKVYILSLCR